ncbi:MAG: hypothetical protein J2P19_26325 [Pseudonocardia sp.]|nr:hypothetical protein [Pseudonocardia sp.]
MGCGFELWKPARGEGRWRTWLAFLFGVALSLCANIASAPELSAFAVAVAVCPPLALLLAVELLNRALKRHRANTGHPQEPGMRLDEPETSSETDEPITETPDRIGQIASEANRWTGLAAVSPDSERRDLTAEQRMWVYYKAQHAQGR